LGAIVWQILDTLLELPPDSSKGIEKKEKLVSIYLTVIAILAALKGIPDKNGITLLAYFLFFILIIFYFMYVGSKTDIRRLVASICGVIAATVFSGILVSLTIPLFSIKGIFFWSVLTFTIAMSLIQPLDKENTEYPS
jgi:ABC-type xylose transport system permease subunit